MYQSNAWVSLYSVYNIKIDKNGEIWAVGTDCFTKYNPEYDIWGEYRYSLDGFMNLRDLLPDKDGFIWLADEHDGLAKYVNKDNISYYNPSNSGLLNQSILFITIEDSIKWIAPYSFGLYKFDNQNWAYNYSLPYDFIKYIAIDNERNKWLATDYSYLVKFNDNETIIYDSANSGIPSPRINWIAIDKDNNKWLASAWRGLAKFDGAYSTVYDTSNSDLPSDDISCVAVDSKSNKWIGTYYYGLVKFDNEIFEIFDTINSELPDNFITSINIDENDIIWVGTENGLVRINDNNWTIFNEFVDYITGLTNNNIRSINFDKKRNTWIGFYHGGIAKYDGNDWKFYNVSNSGLPNDYIHCIAIDSSGKIWVATDGGIGVLDESAIGVEDNKFEKDLLFIQNSPNPFSESTKFRFNLVQSANVNLIIFNSLGLEIAVLVDGWQAGGEQEIKFDGSGLSAGVYYYRLIAGQEFYSGKMMIAR